ncbi:GCN5-related N-acetyltransferase [[Synechococcus] sp. NIES-970]|nr:GCN5-related N-acetyltransferase [[Synechococcus] sp. NIES-970]
MIETEIIPYREEFKEQVLDLVISAWQPVFEKTIKEVPRFVYDNFWPKGWQVRQIAEVSSLLDSNPENVWLAFEGDSLAGFIAVAIHPEDRMGEISIVAVSPGHQRKGVGKELVHFAEQYIRDSGMNMVMVETVGDSGHKPARSTYEALGYVQWPVARYFKEL